MMTGTKKPESEFQAQAIKTIRQMGGYVIKIHVSAYESQGEPDLVCCYLGQFVAFELKVKGNKPSKLQQYKIEKIIQAGGVAKAVYSIEEIQEVLHEIFRVQHGSKSE